MNNFVYKNTEDFVYIDIIQANYHRKKFELWLRLLNDIAFKQLAWCNLIGCPEISKLTLNKFSKG